MATFWAAAAVFIADQVTKLWIRASFSEEEALPVVGGFLNIVFVRNRGGAFGIFPGRQFLFIALSAIVIAAIVWLHRGYAPGGIVPRIAVGMILGGAVGNLVDRILIDRDGCVTDWLDVHWGAAHWPAFNIADSGITVGTVLIVILMWRAEKK